MLILAFLPIILFLIIYKSYTKMLDYLTLQLKPIIEKKSDAEGTKTVKFMDLASSTINYDVYNYYDNCTIVEVTKEYIARPDLISLAIYGTDRYADIICKLNGISNPFELNTGMLIIIPDISNISRIIKEGKKSSLIEDNNGKINKVNKTNRKFKDDIRQVNEQTIGETTYRIDKKNKLIYY